MPEDFEDQQLEGKLDTDKYWKIVQRRRWYLIVPLFVIWVMVYAVSWVMPSVYRSSTLILVEESSLSKSVAGVSDSDLQDRLDSIQQQVFSRTALLRIISKLNLYPKKQKHASPDELVELMRKDATIELVRSPGKSELSSFNINFSSDNPYIAQQVTTELANNLISENLEVSQQNANNTVSFFDDQLETARRNLADQDQKVRVFKDKYPGELPGSTQTNLQIMQTLQTQLQGEQDALGRAQQQNATLKSMASQYKGLRGIVRPTGGTSAPSGLAGLDAELEQLRSKLADLQARYTPQHPDVRKMKEQIAATEKARAQMAADLKAKSSDNPGSTPDAGEKDLPLIQVESELKGNELEISNRQKSIIGLTQQINEYQAKLNRAPIREQELADLTRDYEQSHKDYEALLAKRNAADLGRNLGKSEQGEHFRMIDPPSLPTKPYSPKRFQFSLGGLFGGLALGLALVFGMEFMDDRIYDEKQFREMLPVEIMAEIPPLTTPQEEINKQRQARVEWAAAGALSFVLLIGVAFSFLRG